MKIETFSCQSKEIYITGRGLSVMINTWGNLKGANIQVHADGEHPTPLMAGSFRWEEIDVIMAAFAAAKAA